MFTSVEIYYQTVSLPPPYSYYYSLRAHSEDEVIRVCLDWKYTDRGELTNEEIEEEGFSVNDDFSWEGTLPEVWRLAFYDLLRSTQWLPDTTTNDTSFRVTVNEPVKQATARSPRNAEAWEYFMQEVVQAVYEAAQREQPLQLAHLVFRKGSRPVELHWKASFLLRCFTQTLLLNGRQQERQVPWLQLRPLLQAWYIPDYHSEKAEEGIPRQVGEYIDPGDGNWYQLGKAVTNPGKFNAVGRLKTVIQRLRADSE